MINEITQLKHLIGVLKNDAILPKKIDISKVGSRYWISSYDSLSSEIIGESIYTGMSNSKEVATLKSLTEKVERLAIIQGAREGLQSCQTERSDGFACLPRCYPNASERARENALNEAIERYVWSTWWDDHSIAFQHFNYFSKFKNLHNYGTLAEMGAEARFDSPFCIVPETNLKDKVVAILIARLAGGGFVSGGACGHIDQFEDVFMRGLDELFRHAMGVQKMKRENLKPKTFYEFRLAYFGLGHGDHLVKSRITMAGTNQVQLPELIIDEEVPHKYDHEFVVHRCLFKGQPPFVGGDLARLCL